MASKSERFAPVVDHPWRVIALTILVAGGLGYFMQFLAPSITFRDLLGPGFPGLADYDYVQAEYTKDDNALVMIEAVNGDPFTEEILAGVHALTWGDQARPDHAVERSADHGPVELKPGQVEPCLGDLVLRRRAVERRRGLRVALGQQACALIAGARQSHVGQRLA